MRRHVRLVILGAWCVVVCRAVAPAAQTPATALADLMLTNGKIVTVDERFTIAQAIAVKGDRIVAVGTNQDITRLAGPNTRRIDLRGQAVIPGSHRQPHASAARGHHLAAGAPLRRHRVAKAGDRDDSRPRGGGRAGRWVFNIGGWATAQFADEAKAFTREELDRIAPNNPVALQESYYQVFLNSRGLEAFGIQRGCARPADSSRARSCATPPAGRLVSSKETLPPPGRWPRRLPRVAPEQLEASSLALVKDMNRAGLTSFGVAGCNADVLEIFQKWKAQGRLDVRVFCIGGASAGTPEQVDRSIPQIAQMKLYQGDEYIDQVVFGESVYTPLHDPMFAVKSESTARSARAVAPHGDGDCQGRPAAARARGADATRSMRSSTRSRRSTRNIRSGTCAGRSPT